MEKSRDKVRTTVRVAGHDFTLNTYDGVEHVQRVAKYVDRTLSDLTLSTRLHPTQVAVLGALTIADDMIKARDEVTKLRTEIAALHKQLDDAAAGRPAE